MGCSHVLTEIHAIDDLQPGGAFEGVAVPTGDDRAQTQGGDPGLDPYPAGERGEAADADLAVSAHHRARSSEPRQELLDSGPERVGGSVGDLPSLTLDLVASQERRGDRTDHREDDQRTDEERAGPSPNQPGPAPTLADITADHRRSLSHALPPTPVRLRTDGAPGHELP